MFNNRFGFFSGHQQGENQNRQQAFEQAMRDILGNSNIVPGRISIEVIRPDNSLSITPRLSK